MCFLSYFSLHCLKRCMSIISSGASSSSLTILRFRRSAVSNDRGYIDFNSDVELRDGVGGTNVDEDVDELFSISHGSPGLEANIWTYLFAGPFQDVSGLRGEINHRLKEKTFPYTVIMKDTGKKVGSLSLMNIFPEHKRIEVGFIWYSPTVQKTFVNTEAVFVLMQFVFEDWKAKRLEWKCNNLNERSKAAALRFGFKFEGLFRKHMIIRGQNRDTAWFSIIDSEWPEVKQTLLDKMQSYKK